MEWELNLKTISDIGANRYQVTFVDDAGNEATVVCELSETGIGVGMNWESSRQPDVFTMGRADSKTTIKALIAFREREQRGES